MRGAQQVFLKLLHGSIAHKMHLTFAKRPTSNGSKWKYLIAQWEGYVDKDENVSEHLPRKDTALVLSSEHCGSLKGPQASAFTYNSGDSQV